MCLCAGPGSHYCEHIGRCHQSNRVFFVVNFLTGMLAQKCHDPECSHFRYGLKLCTFRRVVICVHQQQIWANEHQSPMSSSDWYPQGLVNPSDGPE